MIYTITLNPSLDYVMMVNELKNGETNPHRQKRFILAARALTYPEF